MNKSILSILILSSLIGSEAYAELNKIVSCDVGPTRPEKEYHVYTMGERLIARTQVNNSNICLGGGCGESAEIYYEGLVGESPIILEKSAVEFIELSAMPRKKGQSLIITSTVKGNERLHERDSVYPMNCKVLR